MLVVPRANICETRLWYYYWTQMSQVWDGPDNTWKSIFIQEGGHMEWFRGNFASLFTDQNSLQTRKGCIWKSSQGEKGHRNSSGMHPTLSWEQLMALRANAHDLGNPNWKSLKNRKNGRVQVPKSGEANDRLVVPSLFFEAKFRTDKFIIKIIKQVRMPMM